MNILQGLKQINQNQNQNKSYKDYLKKTVRTKIEKKKYIMNPKNIRRSKKSRHS